MEKPRHIIFLILFMLVFIRPLPCSAQEVTDEVFTCADLVGLTYSVRVPLYGYVCDEFISSDMFTETYETIGSFDSYYNVVSQVPCMIQMTVAGFNSWAQVQFSKNGEFFYGLVLVGDLKPIGFPIWGHRVHQPECVPGRLLSDTQGVD